MSSALLLVTLIFAQAGPGDREATRRRVERILAEETTRKGGKREVEGKKPGEVRSEDSKPAKSEKDDSMEPPPVRRGGGGAWILQAVFILVMAVVLALMLGAIWSWWQTRRRGGPAPAAPEKTPDPVAAAAIVHRDPDEWLAEARRFATLGNYAEALRCLLLATMETLHRGRLIDWERARTNRECVRQFRGNADLRSGFSSIVDLFDAAIYGRRGVRPEDYAAAETQARRLRAGVGDEALAG